MYGKVKWMGTSERANLFLTFLKRSHNSFPSVILQERNLLVSLQQIGENSDTFGFVVAEEFVGELSSQFPIFSSFLRRRMAEWPSLKSSAIVLVVKLSSSTTAAKSDWSSKFDDQPLSSSSAKFVSPDWKTSCTIFQLLAFADCSFITFVEIAK